MCRHFTDPFRYVPGDLVRKAAREVIERIDSMADGPVRAGFSEGKMLGVLICKDRSGETVGLSAFSGSVGGCSHVEGFVPPIYDLMEKDGEFKTREAEITAINNEISGLESSEEYISSWKRLEEAEHQAAEELESMRLKATSAKAERERIRRETCDEETINRLTKESQHEKASIKRAKTAWKSTISALKAECEVISNEIASLKRRRAEMSDRLQKWIFSQYIVHNGIGESKSIGEIFADAGLTPPGGTGDCAAPKLLEHAWRNGLEPIEMGEFWYGMSSLTAVRVHGHFYPSCTSKCGPLLNFMMQGLDISHDETSRSLKATPEIIYQDEHIIAVNKPSGMPSVPGLDGRTSMQEWLSGHCGHEVYSIHRLDMDTSGIIIFAKDSDTASVMMKMFEERKVSKTYHAILSAPEDGRTWKVGAKGTISLSLGPDYDERPRQKADQAHGKEAVTEYCVMETFPDGRALLEMHPLTGRTHQLRVHAAHPSGLGCPIAGDTLYGGTGTLYEETDAACTGRLCLHAHSISFTHPHTGAEIMLCSKGDICQ